MVDMSFSPGSFADVGFSPPSVSISADYSGPDIRSAQQQYQIEPEEAVRSFASMDAEGEKGGIFSGIGSFIQGKIDDFKTNPVKSVVSTLVPTAVGLAVPPIAPFIAGAKATGILGLIANDLMFDRGPGIMEADFMADPRGGPDSFIDSPALGTYNSGLPAATYAQEQADYISEGQASLDSPYPPAATATPTQSQSSIPPAANPYFSNPGQYNVSGLNVQYPTFGFPNVVAPAGTPYYLRRMMAAGGFVDQPLYPEPRTMDR